MKTFLAYLNFCFGLVLLGAGVIFYLPGGDPLNFETVLWTLPVFACCAATVYAGARVLKKQKAGWGIAGIAFFIVGFAYFLFATVALTLRSFF